MDTSLPYAVLSEPGAFALGTADGKAVDTAVRLLAEWLDRTSTQVTVWLPLWKHAFLSSAIPVGWLPSVVPLYMQGEVFWGYKRRDVETDSRDVSEHGIRLPFVVAAF